mmetsp:Transcript_2365/g.2588  ORF Transcript_2365/g.2588 Transcript_2365/m.2588 type:complete len:121 (+) Transcript_2365:154-516(+)
MAPVKSGHSGMIESTVLLLACDESSGISSQRTAVGRNLSFSKVCQSREVITYEQDPNDPSKTIYTQRMSYSISGMIESTVLLLACDESSGISSQRTAVRPSLATIGSPAARINLLWAALS